MSTTYHCSPHISWVADTTQIIVVDERQRCHYYLRGVDAAIWNWLTLAYPYARLLQLLTLLLAVPSAQAAARLQAALQKWIDARLLIPEGQSDG